MNLFLKLIGPSVETAKSPSTKRNTMPCLTWHNQGCMAQYLHFNHKPQEESMGFVKIYWNGKNDLHALTPKQIPSNHELVEFTNPNLTFKKGKTKQNKKTLI